LQNATAEKPVAKGEDGQMPTSPKIYVKACINGARTPDQHPNLPVTPERLAAEALAAHGAGAKAVHMHPKAADGVDSLLPQHVDAAVAAVRLAAPGLPLGVTTGFWALPDADARLSAVDGWTVLPDFASVNWHEPGSEDLARLLLSKGLGVEVGIFHAEAAESWAASEMAQHCNTRGSAVCRPASGWRTRCGCRTGRPLRTTRLWCPRRSSCSVGRRGQCEVGVVETRYHYTADQAGHVVTGTGALPVPWRHDDLRLFPGEDIGAKQMRCGTALFGSDLQQQRTAVVV
jgi:hypothetical protein